MWFVLNFYPEVCRLFCVSFKPNNSVVFHTSQWQQQESSNKWEFSFLVFVFPLLNIEIHEVYLQWIIFFLIKSFLDQIAWSLVLNLLSIGTSVVQFLHISPNLSWSFTAFALSSSNLQPLKWSVWMTTPAKSHGRPCSLWGETQSSTPCSAWWETLSLNRYSLKLVSSWSSIMNQYAHIFMLKTSTNFSFKQL